MDRAEQLLSFLGEAARLKDVARQIWVPDHSRQENDAEHSWHVAMFLLVFEKELPAGFDRLRALKMALIHDLVEIYAGDTFAFDAAGRKSKHAREESAAKKLFAQLPADLAAEFFALVSELEQSKTPEARAVRSCDKLQALLSNAQSDSFAFKKHKVPFEQVAQYSDPHLEKTPQFLRAYARLLGQIRKQMEK